jgi:hypothetical protein
MVMVWYGKIHKGKNLFDNFSVQKGVKQEDDLSPLLLSFAL